MNFYPIKHELPVPEAKTKLPFSQMVEVGDHFFLPNRRGETTAKTRKRLSGSLMWQKVKYGKRFRTESSADGVTVWLIAKE